MKKGLLIALITIIADQLHKYYMIYIMQMARVEQSGLPVIQSGGRTLEVTSFFNLVMVWNRGVSFGMFNHGVVVKYQSAILAVMAVLIICGLLLWLRRATNNVQIWGIALIIGGALSNVIDRVRYGAVADFLDFHIGPQHWPAFNIADSCICIGVFVLIFESFFVKRNPDEKN